MFRIVNWIPFEKKENYYLDSLKDVSILIKTLERPEQLINQLYSIQKYRFKGPIIIGDDSKIPYKEKVLALFPKLDITYVTMPFDTGTAEGRNIMLQYTKTPLFVLCDDDFIFEPRTRLPLMRKMLLENNLDLLGGVFRQYYLKSRKEKLKFTISNWIYKNWNILIPSTGIFEYSANFELVGKSCVMKKMVYKDPFTICDMTHNFFIARTDKVTAFNGWNPLLKGGEHQNFFIRAKLNGLKVATTRQCGVVHDRWSPAPELFKELRERGATYQKIALDEFGIEKVENFKEVMKEKFGV
ncbi:MAG: glycosyltransferase [Flavobacterium sp.]|nr:glycosyltransferase [Flavobacterium sp.]